MLETIFGSILTAGLTGSAFVICLLVALALGALVAAVYMYKNTYTQSMAVTLALLPAMGAGHHSARERQPRRRRGCLRRVQPCAIPLRGRLCA